MSLIFNMINLFRNFSGREKIIDSEGDYLFAMDTSFFDENGVHYYRLPINKSMKVLELEASFVLNYYIPLNVYRFMLKIVNCFSVVKKLN